MAHILVVEPDPAGSDYAPDNRWHIECAEPDKCNGWQECPEPHPSDDELDPCQEDEAVLHGVLHTYHWQAGWTVPYNGCVVRGVDAEPPGELYRKTDDGEWYLPVGRWIVEDDWDDTDCILTLVGTDAGDADA